MKVYVRKIPGSGRRISIEIMADVEDWLNKEGDDDPLGTIARELGKRKFCAQVTSRIGSGGSTERTQDLSIMLTPQPKKKRKK